ncbi:hypothetical protein Micbo1qcDRAFT_205713 [Microdochium bolleyi]|uniref:Uncharacterized protein n=1 Tax=Microdochium bolleyi TaxID=196109 RepID=A0A136IYM1_9PEZI|nr:hypothetical protein Micbo1qcDRAFT_205713 [Microdochium bolleyi]
MHGSSSPWSAAGGHNPPPEYHGLMDQDTHPAALVPASSDRENDETHYDPGSWLGETLTMILALLLQGGIVALLFFMNTSKPSSLSTASSSPAALHAVGGAIGQLKWIEYTSERRTIKMWEVYDGCSRGPDGQSALSEWGAPDTASRDPGIRSAIMQGIFGIESNPGFRCGGACSWPGTYRTLAFTSTCSSITQATTATQKGGNDNPDNASELVRNSTTPGGVNLKTRYMATDSATVLVLNTTTNPVFRKHIIATRASIRVFRSLHP